MTEKEKVGDVTTPAAKGEPVEVEIPARPREMPDKLALKTRWEADGRWPAIEPIRDEMMRECRKVRNMSKEEAQAWTYSELDRLYPPLPEPDDPEPEDATGEPIQPVGGQVRGLTDLPADWPDLPGNASIQAELSWVQSERLRVIATTGSGATVVDLSRASQPAPSMAALSWLETSIRHNAKFVDVAARFLKDEQDEQGHEKREHASINEIRGILAEMNDQWAEELVANTSETIREKVRSLLEDWASRSGLTIPDKAKYDLGAHVGELVDKCVGILAPSARGE